MQRRYLLILTAIFILGAALRIGHFYLNTYNMDFNDDEPWSKINLAQEWAHNPTDGLSLNFGPLHTYMISLLWFISKQHYVLLSRMISLAFGILFILVYFALLKETTDIKSALFSTFLLALYPLHIHLSSVSLAEIPAAFLLFSSLYFLCKFIKESKVYYLIISAAALSLSSMLRFEVCVFVFLFGLILFLKYKFSRYTFLFFALSCSFFIFWLIYNYRCTGDPLYFLKSISSGFQSNMENRPLFKRAFGFIWALVKGQTLPVFILCLAGFILSLLKGPARSSNVFILLFSSLLLLSVLNSLQGKYDYTTLRYSLFLGLLFLPFGGLLVGVYFNKFMKLLFLGPLILLCLLYSVKSTQSFYIESKNAVTSSLINLISWIKSNIKNEEKVLLECGIKHPFIVINSNLDSVKQLVEYNYPELCKNKNLDKYLPFTDYIVFNKYAGFFKDAISNNKFFEKLQVAFENEDWRVLKLKK